MVPVTPRGYFVVTKNGAKVPGFRIVYIHGSPGKPSHRDLVKKFPDVRHISFEEMLIAIHIVKDTDPAELRTILVQGVNSQDCPFPTS
ncbi:hypothetical protein EC957_008399 [Mortierella hygrophila]|uniref:Uncharacterized protein n=1 Tax=Mortierella hygrophila TaxID=979708 RepID=A0A9P6JXM3_9FUNG|nr:hypothetical protein EC957_008399 [Mortierella hygrophila]